MGETIDDIREQKRKELQEKAGDETAEPATPDSPVHVEDESHFEELTTDHDVVLADFYADWCGPCRQLEPIVESLAEKTPATIAKVDVDEQQRLAQQYGVRGVPTMVLFSDGEAVERIVGVRGEDELASLIDSYS